MESLSHVDAGGRPRMVDVGGKPATARRAVAEAWVALPPEVAACFDGRELNGPKGPVFHTAILAGVQAAKRTGGLIPLCHPLALDHVAVELALEPSGDGSARLRIRCGVSVHGRTGVEMEALTGAAVAALAVVDMCKALRHDLVIDGLRILEKEGGRRVVRDGRLVQP